MNAGVWLVAWLLADAVPLPLLPPLAHPHAVAVSAAATSAACGQFLFLFLFLMGRPLHSPVPPSRHGKSATMT